MKHDKELIKKLGIEIFYKPGAFDCFSVVIRNDVYGMSKNPRSAMGFNVYRGDISEFDREALGSKISFEECPEEVQEAIIERAKGYVKEPQDKTFTR